MRTQIREQDQTLVADWGDYNGTVVVGGQLRWENDLYDVTNVVASNDNDEPLQTVYVDRRTPKGIVDGSDISDQEGWGADRGSTGS